MDGAAHPPQNHEGVTGKTQIEKYQQERKRPEEEWERPQQDPKMDTTPKGLMDGAAHPPKSYEGVTGKTQTGFRGPRDKTGSLGSSGPGLRAIRTGRASVGSNGGEQDEGASTTSERAKGKSADVESSRGEQSVQVRMKSGGREVCVDVKVSEPKNRSEASTTKTQVKSDEKERGGYEKELTTKNSPGTATGVQDAEFLGMKQSSHVTAGYSGTSASAAQGAAGSMSFRGTSGGSLIVVPEANSMSAEGQRKCAEEPWELQRFVVPPSLRSDKWDLSLAAYGWYIKVHGKPRKRNFHPLHRSTPVLTTDLQTTRTTVVFGANGERRVVQDLWPDSGNVLLDDTLQWRGYTFFKMVAAVDGAADAVAGRDPESPSSDSSFEKVREP